MKSLRFLFLPALLLFVHLLTAQTEIPVPERQIPLLTKISASWCPYCGTWGWDLMEGLFEDNSYNSSVITVHYSGDYKTDAGAKMTSNFGAVGQPQFFLNSEKLSVSGSTADSKRSEIKTAVAANAAMSPAVQSGLVAGTYEGQFNVLTNTKFFVPADGEYYLGLYLLQKEFVGPQAGRSGDSLHKNLLRKNLTDGAFGELLAQGQISAGTKVFLQKSFSLNDIAYALENISVLSIVWKKEGNRYLVVNTNLTTDMVNNLELSTTGLRSLSPADFTVEVAPNIITETARLQLEFPSLRPQFSVELWDLNGRKVQDIYRGALPAGRHDWTITRDGLASGVYLLRLQDGQRQWSERIIFR
ncbi:MAG: T9SS type A sorting domain-containing protein [Saprospiraceae bacterium]